MVFKISFSIPLKFKRFGSGGNTDSRNIGHVSRQRRQVSTMALNISIEDAVASNMSSGVDACEDPNTSRKIRTTDSFSSDNEGKICLGNYQIIRYLGAGNQAKVLLAEDSTNNEMVALKIFAKNKITSRTMKQINVEVSALRKINHPNILQLNEIIDEAKLSNASEYAYATVLVLEYCSRGELFDVMLQTGGFSDVIARTYFLQISSAISACHAAGIYHRDIKPQNLLLDSRFQIKVADFGISSLHLCDETDICNTYCGTPNYMAPEVFIGGSYSGSKVDSWSLGIVLFMMLAGNPPLKVATTDDWWYRAILTGRMDKFWKAHSRFSQSFSKQSQEIISRLLVADPDERSSVMDIMSDPWLEGELMNDANLSIYMSKQVGAAQTVETTYIGVNIDKKKTDSIEAEPNNIVIDKGNIKKHIITAPQCPLKKNILEKDKKLKCKDIDLTGSVDGFYIYQPTSIKILYILQEACVKSGAAKVLKSGAWSVTALYLSKVDRSMVPSNLNKKDRLELTFQLFSMVLKEDKVTFVKVDRKSDDTVVVNTIIKAMTLFIPSASLQIKV